MQTGSQHVRPLTSCDLTHVQKLLLSSDYVYQRFTFQELPRLLEHYPAYGLFRAGQLESFLLSQSLNPPVAWIGGFGVNWSEHRQAFGHLDRLLDCLQPDLQARGVTQLYYSGNDLEQDWLRTPLLRRGFAPHSLLYCYDKFDYRVPTQGNQEIRVRNVRGDDLAALCDIERLCFAPLWRYDALAFADIAATHPYFVVAELGEEVVGYQFNAVDEGYGYLIRIAVHPAFSGRGIGTRLMAEAINFFAQARVRRIMLNTQEDNQRAHRLYEWFGFVRMPQRGFILHKELSLASSS
jgi:ribosomal protein S18 acetylase RimI-like enzyme